MAIHKTIKELCREAGLEPIPFQPVPELSKRALRPKRKMKLTWSCVCGWIGEKTEMKKEEGRIYCPVCNGPGGYDVFPIKIP